MEETKTKTKTNDDDIDELKVFLKEIFSQCSTVSNDEVKNYIIHPMCQMIYLEIYPYITFVLAILVSIFVMCLSIIVFLYLIRKDFKQE
jgi:hypothetical protein